MILFSTHWNSWGNIVSWMLRKNDFQPRILYPLTLPAKCEGRTFWSKKSLRKYCLLLLLRKQLGVVIAPRRKPYLRNKASDAEATVGEGHCQGGEPSRPGGQPVQLEAEGQTAAGGRTPGKNTTNRWSDCWTQWHESYTAGIKFEDKLVVYTLIQSKKKRILIPGKTWLCKKGNVIMVYSKAQLRIIFT